MYVRTALRVVENMQVCLVRHARKAMHGGPDYFGEEHLLASFRAHTLAQGWDEQHAEELEEKLGCASYYREVKAPGPRGTLDAAGATPTGAAASHPQSCRLEQRGRARRGHALGLGGPAGPALAGPACPTGAACPVGRGTG